jgi:hypothetical protein
MWSFIPLVVLAVGMRRFMLLTDINVGYGYHYKKGWGWMPFFDIRSSPSARRHVLCDVKSKRRRKLFGIPFEELTGFDRTLNGHKGCQDYGNTPDGPNPARAGKSQQKGFVKDIRTPAAMRVIVTLDGAKTHRQHRSGKTTIGSEV